MAVPFHFPDENNSSSQGVNQHQTQPTNTIPNTPTRPVATQQHNDNSHSPQLAQIDNETLVQAFYEALCRCSQGQNSVSLSSPASPYNREHFWFPILSNSTTASPRSSFRSSNGHRRIDSFGNLSILSDDIEDLFHWEQEGFSSNNNSDHHQPNLNNQKKPNNNNNNKIRNFVINALQFVIDTLR